MSIFEDNYIFLKDFEKLPKVKIQNFKKIKKFKKGMMVYEVKKKFMKNSNKYH